MSDFTIKPRKKGNNLEGEELVNKITYEKIEDLQEYIRIQLEQSKQKDNDIIVNNLMYKILLFCISNKCSNEKVLKQEAVKYFKINREELLNTIP
jgi:hypothetical protein